MTIHRGVENHPAPQPPAAMQPPLVQDLSKMCWRRLRSARDMGSSRSGAPFSGGRGQPLVASAASPVIR